MRALHFAALFVGLAAASALAGCDGGDPITPPTPADVAGTYAPTVWRFTPDASAIRPANVLDTLDASATALELLDSGQFLLRYRFAGGSQQFVAGEFGVTSRQVGLEFPASARAELERLLLADVTASGAVRLALNRREDGSLDLDEDYRVRTVDLEAFSPGRYGGLPSIRGTLRFTAAPTAP